MSDSEKLANDASPVTNEPAAQPTPPAPGVSPEHDDSAQKEARATLAAIAAAMAERSKQPLVRRDGLVQPGDVSRGNGDSEDESDSRSIGVASAPENDDQSIPMREPGRRAGVDSSTGANGSEDQIMEESEKLDGDRVPAGNSLQDSDSSGKKYKLGRTKRPEKPGKIGSGWKWQVLGGGAGKQTDSVGFEGHDSDAGQNGGAVAARPFKITRSFILIVVAASVISGGIGIVLGLSANQTVVDAVLPVPTGGIGEGPAVSRNLGRDFVGDIVAQEMPIVVSIDTSPREPNMTNGGNGFSFGPHAELRVPQMYKRCLGTGVIVRSDGYVVTSAHVVRGQTGRLFVCLNDSRSLEATVVGKDPFTDIALLKVDARNLPTARFAAKGTTRPGDWAIAIGTPFGFDHSVSLGVVSAIGRSVADLNNHVDLIQTDAAMNPGNSGGPLLNSRGEVIAINAVIRSNAQNIGFAIPADAVRESAKEIMRNGDVKRPYVGIFMAEVDPYRMSKGEPDKGALLARVVPGSPCEKAGLGRGDIVVKLNGLPIETTKDVRELLKRSHPGDILEFVVFRRGSGEQMRKVVIGEYPYE